MLGETGNTRAVRILFEYKLAAYYFPKGTLRAIQGYQCVIWGTFSTEQVVSHNMAERASNLQVM